MRFSVNRTATYTEVEWINVEAATEEEAMRIGLEKWETGAWNGKSEITDCIGDPQWTVEPQI